MNARQYVTDADLEAVLARRAGRGAPLGLADAIDDTLAASLEPRSRRLSLVPPAVPALRFVWMVAIVGLLAASVALVGAQLLWRQDRQIVQPTNPPVPTSTPVPRDVDLSAAQVNQLAFAPDGTLWLATSAGVVHWDVARQTATLYDQNAGLPTTAASQVVVGSDGTVWAAGPNWVLALSGSWSGSAISADELRALGVIGNLHGLAVGPDGSAWVGAAGASGPLLLHFQGTWTATTAPGPAGAALFGLLAAPDGAIWATTNTLDTGAGAGLVAFDGTSWTVYSQEDAGLPRVPWLAGVARDGSAWVQLSPQGCVDGGLAQPTCATPGAGVARLDRTHWTVYTTAEGLADNDAGVFVASDGTVWATYAARPGTISRFTAGRWVSSDVPELAAAHAMAAARDGALWLLGSGVLFRYDGSSVSRHALPALQTHVALPPLALEAEPGQMVTRSSLGTITWRVWDAAQNHFFYPSIGTVHGPVALDGPDLRWLTPAGKWEGVTVGDVGVGLAADGDDLFVYGFGAVRLHWNSARWVVKGPLEFPASLGYVRGLTIGPKGMVATSEGGVVAWSSDGSEFSVAKTRPGGAAATGIPLGPVLATRDGFIALVVATNPLNGALGPFPAPVPWFSADGATWQQASPRSPFGADSYVRAVAAKDGRFVAVGEIGADGPLESLNKVTWATWVSDDGVAWERLSTFERAQPCDSSGNYCSDTLTTVVAGTAGWVILSWDGAAWTSPDGRTWEPLDGGPAIRGGYLPPTAALSPRSIVVVGSLPGAWHDAIAVGAIEP